MADSEPRSEPSPIHHPLSASPASLLIARRIHRHRKRRDVRPLEGGDLAHALLAHLVHAQHRMHRQIGTFDTVEFSFDLLFRRIDHYGGALAEHQLLDLDEAEQRTMADLARIDLVDLALVNENDLENVTDC